MRTTASVLWGAVGGFALAAAAAGYMSPRGGAGAAQASNASLEQRVAALERRLERQEDVHRIERLTRAYGYYVDKQLWDQIVPLFTSDCRIEIAGRGVYLGGKGAERLFKDSMGGGKNGLAPGMLFNHMILQGVVDVSADGRTGRGRWRALMQIARYHGFAIWGEGTYENLYRKENGIWRIADMHFYSTYYTPFEAGWAKVDLPNNGPSKTAPPDLPPSVDYDVLPGHYVPPFHYPNPATGQAWTLDDTARYSTHGMSPKAPAPRPQAGAH